MAHAIAKPTVWASYYELTKPNVVWLIVFTAIVGMMMATPGMVPLPALIFGSLDRFGRSICCRHQSTG